MEVKESFNKSIDYIPSYPPEQSRLTAAPKRHMHYSDEFDVGEQSQSKDDIMNNLDKKWMEVIETSDNSPLPGFEYCELKSPKHTPPSDTAPVSYYFLSFSLPSFLPSSPPSPHTISKPTSDREQQHVHLSPHVRAIIGEI
jgi:hypothetical protein